MVSTHLKQKLVKMDHFQVGLKKIFEINQVTLLNDDIQVYTR